MSFLMCNWGLNLSMVRCLGKERGGQDMRKEKENDRPAASQLAITPEFEAWLEHMKRRSATRIDSAEQQKVMSCRYKASASSSTTALTQQLPPSIAYNKSRVAVAYSNNKVPVAYSKSKDGNSWFEQWWSGYDCSIHVIFQHVAAISRWIGQA